MRDDLSARLEHMTGAQISLAQCLKAEPQNPPQYKNFPIDPVAIEYPALLSVRGTSSALRATGPATACIASE